MSSNNDDPMRFLLPLFVFLINFSLFGQSIRQDTAFFSVSIQNAVINYDSMIKGKEFYYNGSYYKEPPQRGDQHPFLEIDEWQTGSIVYDGYTFENISVLYDLMKQLLISETINGIMFAVNPQKLTEFKIGTRTFMRLNSNNYSNSLPQDTYYEILYKGASMVVALREKSMQERIDNTEIRTLYDERKRFFILHKGTFHQLKGRASLLKILKEQKQSLKALMKEKDLDFINTPEYAYATSAQLFDTLVRQ